MSEILIGALLLMIVVLTAGMLYVISAVEQLAKIALTHSERLDALEQPGWHLAKGYSEPQIAAAWQGDESQYEVVEFEDEG